LLSEGLRHKDSKAQTYTKKALVWQQDILLFFDKVSQRSSDVSAVGLGYVDRT